MRAYRLVKAAYADQPLSAEGAQQFGGRWNSPGIGVVSAADTVSLAALELLVHSRRPEHLRNFVLCSIEFSNASIMELAMPSLPANWRNFPPGRDTQRIGDDWATSRRSLALAVPSAIIPQQRNFLLNPMHKGFTAMAQSATVEPFTFDPRLLAE